MMVSGGDDGCGDDDGCDGGCGSDGCDCVDGGDNDGSCGSDDCGGGDNDGGGDDCRGWVMMFACSGDGSDGGGVVTMVVVVMVIMMMMVLIVVVIPRYNCSLLSLKSQKRFSSAINLGVRLHSHQKPTKDFRSIPNKRSLLTQNLIKAKTISFSVSNIKNVMLPRQC